MIKRGQKRAKKRGTRVLTSVIDNINFCPKSKRSQVTIFIIIAVIIVALAVLVYFIYPKIKTSGETTTNPTVYIEDCLKKDIETNVQKISLQGGSLTPQSYILYNDEKIEYLCYTNENFIPCIMQQPILKTHVEKEIKNSIVEKTKSCFDSLEQNYKNKGYDVTLNRKDYSVELLPQKIVTTFNYDLTLTKGSTSKYQVFKIVLNNNLEELISIANSILNSEAENGDADELQYIDYYHWLTAEKKLQDDGSRVYILTDRDSGNKFEFAVRSGVLSPGHVF